MLWKPPRAPQRLENLFGEGGEGEFDAIAQNRQKPQRKSRVLYFSAMISQEPKRRSLFFDCLFCFWILASQTWYYAQFRPVLGPLVGSYLKRLWH